MLIPGKKRKACRERIKLESLMGWWLGQQQNAAFAHSCKLIIIKRLNNMM